MKKRRLHSATVVRSMLAGALVILCGCPKQGDDLAPPLDAAFVRGEMETVIAFLDSPEYATATSWGEHVVLAYRVAQGRNPTLVEFVMLELLRDEMGLKRSDILSLALGGDDTYPAWDKCRSFLKNTTASSFKTDAGVRSAAQKLAKTSDIELLLKVLEETAVDPFEDLEALSLKLRTRSAPNVEYETYFGFLHAHSNLSLDADPDGSPLEAYTFARDQGGLDFFSLTDHGIFLVIWPWDNKWERLKEAAEATNDPGTYVTLWGFEWSNPLLGHINIINSTDFAHTLAPFRIVKLYHWLAAHPNAFGRFNHPGDYNYLGIEFLQFFPYCRVVPQMVGVETWNTDRSFDTYHYAGSWCSPLSFLDVGNQNGWYLGALGAQDNHERDWGVRNDFRTAVLAEELTREAIIDAYANRRIYATEDKDLHLDFRSSGYPMGSRLTGVPSQFDVAAHDDSGDVFAEVRIYRNGALLETQTVSGNTISVAFADPDPTGDDYYYVIVTQTDDNDGNGRNDEAISSPIWIEN